MGAWLVNQGGLCGTQENFVCAIDAHNIFLLRNDLYRGNKKKIKLDLREREPLLKA